MFAGALGAAAANLLLLRATGLAEAIPLRVLTGIFLAGIYPSALKEVSTWFQKGRGTALGVMIGALTLGSALPHLVNSFGNMLWHNVIGATSALTACGGLLALLLRGSGPYAYPRRPFRVRDAVASLRNRSVMLANIGYVGHMWELYAMWACIGGFLASLPAIAGRAHSEAVSSALAFVCIGAGSVGCLVGGRLSDRYGRAEAALVCLLCSGGAALTLSFLTSAAVWIILVLCIFWGFWVIADSAQFSALVTEHADPVYVGGALAVQLALGYLTTVITLWLVPVVAERTSWSSALALLTIGPAIGAAAMFVLTRSHRGSRAESPPVPLAAHE